MPTETVDLSSLSDECCPQMVAGASRIGITRISEITRLDCLNVPTVTAIRSQILGESITVCSGAGRSHSDAWTRAVAEAFERFCAEQRGHVPTVRARVSELPSDEIVGPKKLITATWAPSGDPILEWCRGACLSTGKPLWIPANAVFFPYEPSGVPLIFSPSTNGLAAGRDLEEAIYHGLLECIERDAYSIALAKVTAGITNDFPMIDVATLSPLVQSWVSNACDNGLQVMLRDITHDIKIPTLLCTLAQKLPDGSLWAHAGIAAHPDPHLAAERSVAEAAQSRLVDVQGAREDLVERHEEGAVHPWFVTEESHPTSLPEPFRQTTNSEDSVSAILRGMSKCGIASPVVVDLSIDYLPVRCIRVVTPGLEFWAKDPARCGKRIHSYFAEQ